MKNYDKNQTKKRKAIAPLVATALLLLISVISFLFLEGWFQTLSSSIMGDADVKTSGGSSWIEGVFNSELYFRNGFNDNLTLNKILIDGKNCNITYNTMPGINQIPIYDCVSSLSAASHEVILFSDVGIYTKKFYIDPAQLSPSIDCSNLNGGTWIKVPGNSEFGTEDFCVMKYEAKALNTSSGTILHDGCRVSSCLRTDFNASSHVNGSPWVNINHTDSIAECNNLGTDYHLISNKEWMSIARNIEQQNENWNSTEVGNGNLYFGHSDGYGLDSYPSLSATLNDNDGYYVTGDSSSSSCDGYETNFNSGEDTVTGKACSGQKRTLKLSNGETIWDFSGNVWEWNLDLRSDFSIDSTTDGDWILSDFDSERPQLGPSNSGW